MATKKSSTAGVAPAAEGVEKATAEKEAAGLVPVLVTTALPSGRSGVFFGWADPIAAQSGNDRIELQSARNVFFWAENSGSGSGDGSGDGSAEADLKKAGAEIVEGGEGDGR